MRYRPAIKTSRIAVLNYYLAEAAKPDEEWSCQRHPRYRDLWQTNPVKDMELSRAIDGYDGHGEPPEGWTKTTFPNLVQKIGRKLDRKKPQCFACHAPFDDWRKGLERAHIVAENCGGEDKPSNFVLLCSDCHRNAPMTNCADWMLEWVDRGPAAPGWERSDALDDATNAEMLAALNYVRYGSEPYTAIEQAVGIKLEGADTSSENLQRTWREVADEFEPDMHFGSSSYSPATRALIMLEAWGRVALKLESHRRNQNTADDL